MIKAILALFQKSKPEPVKAPVKRSRRRKNKRLYARLDSLSVGQSVTRARNWRKNCDSKAAYFYGKKTGRKVSVRTMGDKAVFIRIS